MNPYDRGALVDAMAGVVELANADVGELVFALRMALTDRGARSVDQALALALLTQRTTRRTSP